MTVKYIIVTLISLTLAGINLNAQEEEIMILVPPPPPPPPVSGIQYKYPRGFPYEIKEKRPSEILPNADIKKDWFTFSTTRIDTIQMEAKLAVAKFDTTELFYYRAKGKYNSFYMVKRKNDWLGIRASTLKNVNLNTSKFKFVKVGKNDDLFLEILVDKPENSIVRQLVGRRTEELWKNVKMLSLFNLNTKEYYLHNVILGYDYQHKKWEGKGEEKITTIERSFLDYHFEMNYKKGTIKINEVANFFEISQQKGKLEPTVLSKKENTCAPLQFNGVYELKGSKFVKKDS